MIVYTIEINAYNKSFTYNDPEKAISDLLDMIIKGFAGLVGDGITITQSEIIQEEYSVHNI